MCNVHESSHFRFRVALARWQQLTAAAADSAKAWEPPDVGCNSDSVQENLDFTGLKGAFVQWEMLLMNKCINRPFLVSFLLLLKSCLSHLKFRAPLPHVHVNKWHGKNKSCPEKMSYQKVWIVVHFSVSCSPNRTSFYAWTDFSERRRTVGSALSTTGIPRLAMPDPGSVQQSGLSSQLAPMCYNLQHHLNTALCISIFNFEMFKMGFKREMTVLLIWSPICILI